MLRQFTKKLLNSYSRQPILVQNRQQVFKKFYCTNNNNNYHDFKDFKTLFQSIKELSTIKTSQIKDTELPTNLLQIRNDILKCNENELNTQQRVFSSIYLWESICLLNSTPHTMNKKELEKLWNLLNLPFDNLSDKDIVGLLSQRMAMGFSSRYLVTKLKNDIIECIKQIEKPTADLKRLEPLIIVAWQVAAHLGMFNEMKTLGKFIEKDKLDMVRDNSLYYDHMYDYTSIDKILNEPSSTIVNNENNFKSFRVYEIDSMGFKDLSMNLENYQDEQKRELAIKEFNENKEQLKNQAVDRNGYLIASTTNGEKIIPTFGFFGNAVKLNLCFDTNCQMVHGGIVDDEFKSMKLYGSYHVLYDKTVTESIYTLNIDLPISSDDKESAIQLTGNHCKIETNINNEKTIYNMNVIFNLTRRVLLYEEKQKEIENKDLEKQ